MNNQVHLELYYFPSCPFCQIVLEAIEDLGLVVELSNIQSDRSKADKLIKDTGRRTVPCLYIDQKPMFESADIIRWLKSNHQQLQKK